MHQMGSLNPELAFSLQPGVEWPREELCYTPDVDLKFFLFFIVFPFVHLACSLRLVAKRSENDSNACCLLCRKPAGRSGQRHHGRRGSSREHQGHGLGLHPVPPPQDCDRGSAAAHPGDSHRRLQLCLD